MFLSAALIFSAAGCGSSQDFDTQIFITGLTGKTQQEENAESAEGKLRVMASFYTMADFAEKIGGDRADITSSSGLPFSTRTLFASSTPYWVL